LTHIDTTFIQITRRL